MTPLVELVLYQAFLYHYHHDKMNAAIHTSPVRFSPLTFRLAEVLHDLRPDIGP